MECPHTVQRSAPGDRDVIAFFALAGAPCQDCAEARRQYRDVYLAMAGNVYAVARLAGDGLVLGTGPSLADLDTVGRRLYQALVQSPAWAEADADDGQRLLEALVGQG